LNVGRRFNLANRRYEIDSTTPGPRTFEAAMAGTVQSLYVEGLEIADYFDIGDEIILFDSPSELSAQIEALRAAPAERERLALRSQDRALRDHTYGNRAKELLSRCGFDFGDQTVSSDVRKTLALTPAYAR
jgi:spore maturation protein CgeB